MPCRAFRVVRAFCLKDARASCASEPASRARYGANSGPTRRRVVRGSDRGHPTASGLHRAAAARCFLERAIDLHGEPQKITIDKRPANTAAVTGYPDSTWTRAEGGEETLTARGRTFLAAEDSCRGNS